MSCSCHIFFSKKIFMDIAGISRGLNQENCFQVWYIPGTSISFHVICHTYSPLRSYSCHKFVRLSCSGQIQPEIALLFEFCIPLHSVHQAQQDLFATAPRADSSFASCLGWGRRLHWLLRAGGPRLRGGRQRGGLLVGGICLRGVHLRMGLLGSAR